MALQLESCVRIAVDYPKEVFIAIKPSIGRFLDGGEENSMRALLPFLYAPLPVDPEVRSAFRRDWAQLVESGPIADPTQIFLRTCPIR